MLKENNDLLKYPTERYWNKGILEQTKNHSMCHKPI